MKWRFLDPQHYPEEARSWHTEVLKSGRFGMMVMYVEFQALASGVKPLQAHIEIMSYKTTISHAVSGKQNVACLSLGKEIALPQSRQIEGSSSAGAWCFVVGFFGNMTPSVTAYQPYACHMKRNPGSHWQCVNRSFMDPSPRIPLITGCSRQLQGWGLSPLSNAFPRTHILYSGLTVEIDMSVRYWDSHPRSLKTEKRSHATSPDIVEGVAGPISYQVFV
ncbi:hypothetical protein Bbelb_409950 [Branchiostoma belcheri]|nr:hypothetical protein Bbelb_409950 [Branchiostoma belcheri]